MKFAIIGATGNVGRKTIEILDKSNLKIDDLFLVASTKSAGKKFLFRKKEIKVISLDNYDFSKAKITFFAAGSKVSKEWVPKASKQTIVIDNSSFFRMKDDVPLVVPEVNSDALDNHKNLLIIDDLLATGGTVIAALDLIRKFEAKNVVGAGFLVNLPALGGLEKLENLGIKSKYLVEF